MTLLELRALLPLLLVALTILAAMLLAAFCRHRRLLFWVYQLGLLAALLSLGGNLGIQAQGLEVTPLLRVDAFFGFFAALFILVAMLVGLMAAQYFGRREHLAVPLEESYVLLALCLLGALVLAAAQHLAALFIGLELMSVASFALVAYPCGGAPASDRLQLPSLEAGLKYLLLSSVASAFLLFGMACLYLQTGTLAFARLSLPPDSTASGLLPLAGLAMLLIGVAFKLALAPFHMWSPDVYQGAPTPFTALIATLSKGALVVVLLRYLLLSQALQIEQIATLLMALATLSILVGNLLALRQDDMKRLLAYSSIAHLGYLLVVVLAAGQTVSSEFALQAGAFYLLAYSLTTLAAFAMISALSGGGDENRDYRLHCYRGLCWRAPCLGGCFMLILLSLAGIPLTVGFIGKFYIFAAGAQAGLWWLLGVVVLGSALGLYYYLRIILILLQQDDEVSDLVFHNGRWLVYGLTLLLLLLGIYPLPVMQWLPLL
ncbi:NADH-quinone oxidoreductase subunit N [Marinobacterium sedimentorum]|uniref:NADH-quinone oxidoreductase subunit N n=1 Tax=Marinobacterium sedimentorum TaxID=2927804 RepID=UPI0020C67C99|nr:NADH-quinone oxidoreductase subunit N [Marinobacterium sedimentorum]MCP8686185.1 NADH-quinone oxidoreductase subunit N [Marinobacterium sedimentorum]